jgi:hypothetical protein
MIFKNVTEGPKVLNTLAGPISVPAGGQSDDVELSEGEAKAVEAMGWFESEPAKPAPKAKTTKD